MHRKKRLTLLRHAKAVTAVPSMPDRERPLKDRGRQDALRMGQRLRMAGIVPSLILVSPALRTLETARLVAGETGCPREHLQIDSDLYLASPAEILGVIGRQDQNLNDILVCGHNPGLSELLDQLTGAGIDGLPTCGFGILEAAIGSWDQLRHGRLLQFDYPKKSG